MLPLMAGAQQAPRDPAPPAYASLTVTESPWAVPPESMINFVLVDDKVRFDIAPRVAESNKLKISARLLGVARSLVGQAS